MPIIPVETLLEEARALFSAIGRDLDALAAGESVGEFVVGDVKKNAARLKKSAQETSAKLNSAAPQLSGAEVDALRVTSLMLSEIIMADTPEIALERYHARRDEIDNGLISLGS
jgi:2-polyprenyl-3-methyl-5-hydroxy-6-metoxy-1,4-benzoquinol methylase